MAEAALNTSNIIEFPKVTQQTMEPKAIVSGSKNYDHKRHEAINGTVDPIRSKDDIKAILDYFWNRGEYRNWCLVNTGIHTAFRASDLLRLRVSDVAMLDGARLKVKDKIVLRIKEKKTRKYRSVEMPQSAVRCIGIYIERMNLSYDDWLFPSEKSSVKTSLRSQGGTSIGAKTGKVYRHEASPKKAGDPLDVDSFGKIMRRVQKDLNLPYRLGTHSCRKTFGYWFMQQNKGDAYALAWLQGALNHSSQAITLKYIGLSADVDRDFYNSVDFGGS